MKKFLLCLLLLNLSANAENFMLPQTQNILYDSTYPLNEYIISDEAGSCFFHYLTTEKITKDYTIRTENKTYPDMCLEKGFSHLELSDETGNLIHSWDGYFIDGFFIADLPLNAKVIKRTADENATQYLHFVIDEDKQLNVRYIGTMHAFLDEKGKYTSFDACHPFEITLQTPNKALFENKETLKNLTTVVKNYAQILCPQTPVIILNASDSPSLDKSGIYFTEHLNLNDTPVKTATTLPAAKKTAKKKQPVAHKTAEQLLKQSEQSGVPVLGEFVLHISDRTNEKVVFADKPFIMKAFSNALNLQKGWYRVDATIAPLSDFEKKRSGLSLKEKAALIVIHKAHICQTESCKD